MRHTGIIIYQSELSDYWVDRIKDTGLNFIGVHPVSEKGLGGRTVAELVDWVKAPKTRRLLDRLAEMGVDVEYEMHALSWLLPRDMFSKHPEWFRMNENGERVADYNCCPSNPDRARPPCRQGLSMAWRPDMLPAGIRRRERLP